jgi:hypothetical protein
MVIAVNRTRIVFCLALMLTPSLMARILLAQNGNFVPGMGAELEKVGDDFEDPNWKYIFNNPKSTEENNEKQNAPLGKSANGRWFEGAKRGQPDVVRRVETPPGGIPGSEGALLLQSLRADLFQFPRIQVSQHESLFHRWRNGTGARALISHSELHWRRPRTNLEKFCFLPRRKKMKSTGPAFSFAWILKNEARKSTTVSSSECVVTVEAATWKAPRSIHWVGGL